jgi:hypothetical protein
MVYLIGAKQNDLKSIVLCSTHSIHIYTFFGYNSRKQKSVNNLVTSKITINKIIIIIIIYYYYNPILYNIYINTMKKNNKNKIKKEEERRRRK